MSQYFNWVNFDKREIIADWPWPCGSGLRESAYVGCEKTDAVLTMLASDWAGDIVVFLGDYAHFENETDSNRHEVERRLAGMSCEDYIYSCTDICGRFDYTRDHPEARYPVFSDYGVEEWVPYDGPFDVAIQSFRYVVNESKREFVDRANTVARHVDDSTGEVVRYDPLPELMCSQVAGLGAAGRGILGRWLGDVIRPTNERPGDGYAAVAQDYSCF